MLIIDDILTTPVRGLFWVFNEIHQAALEERETRKENLTIQLSELYLLLEQGQISEAEFETKEQELLDLLEEYETNTE